MIKVNISFGELFDKLSILEIKKRKIKNKNILKNIIFELNQLNKELKNQILILL